MRKHPGFWFKSLGVVCFAAAVLWTMPELAAERFGAGAKLKPSSPLDESAQAEVELGLRTPGLIQLAGGALMEAKVHAQARSVEAADDVALEVARQALLDEREAEAAQILKVLIEAREAALEDEDADLPDEERAALQQELAQAQLMLGHVRSNLGEFEQAAELFSALEGKTPIEDFIHWFQGRALRRAGKPVEAAAALQRAFDEDTTLVKLYAQVEMAHALAEAQDWKKALPVLEQITDAFPTYPRRYQLLFARAEALEALERKDEAARAYQKTWFEFPDKIEGREAQRAMQRLAEQGHAAAPIGSRKLFERYRTLRIDKHWELAAELFEQLLEDNKTPGGHSAFEHEIIAQLALNDYIPQNNEGAMKWFKLLQRDYEAGHTAGIDRGFVYRYLSRMHSRFGDLDAALKALDKANEGKSKVNRQRERAEFLQQHGRYAEAKEIYDEIETDWRKRGWHFTWLLYKTGDYEKAYQNLTRLAERASGERRAKYMYWAARTLALDGNAEEAVKIYGDVARAYEQSYYGIQASNRLLDIAQSETVDEQLIVQARGIIDGASDVLAMMDEEADETYASDAPGAMAEVLGDPRRIQRSVDDEERAASDEPASGRAERAADGAAEQKAARSGPGLDCQMAGAEERRRCELLAAQSPDIAQDILHSALSPYLQYTRLAATGVSRLSADQLNAALDEAGEDEGDEFGPDSGEDAPPPRRDLQGLANQKHRVGASYDTQGRIYWEGRRDSPVAFVNAERGEVIGPMPEKPWAYDQASYQGGVKRAVDSAGELFEQLERAQWLMEAGYLKYARWAVRDLALEYDGLRDRARPGSKPIELSAGRWTHLIDNRRSGKSGLWGYRSEEPRYPVPGPGAERDALLKRQQEIIERKDELKPLIMDALKEVGDFHMVRKFNFGTGPWYREDPRGSLRYKWMQAYPRAFPQKVIRESVKNGVNPYLVWAVMTVESTYNPDSISYADALGLLQVIPRTGIKTAELLGEETFGPMDLINEDVAIRHGAFYLSQLVQKFRGQELLAVAGYNGGPHRVGEWMDQRGENMPMDEFVEEIPFDQARGYTKKIVRYISLYLRIYEGVDQLYIGQKMELDYLVDPNF